jgi:hypothetical protein
MKGVAPDAKNYRVKTDSPAWRLARARTAGDSIP